MKSVELILGKSIMECDKAMLRLLNYNFLYFFSFLSFIDAQNSCDELDLLLFCRLICVMNCSHLYLTFIQHTDPDQDGCTAVHTVENNVQM